MPAQTLPPAPPAPADSPLGKRVPYVDRYAPGLLFALPRASKRAELGLDPAQPPFSGHDLWNTYELSWLNPHGKPVVALGRFVVPADSPCLVESKSLKLYLNSFNQSTFADAAAVRTCIAADLSRCAGAPVAVHIAPLGERPRRELAWPDGVPLDNLDIAIDRYTPAPELLRRADAAPAGEIEELLYSHLLKSNCLVTGQPDWGTLCVRYRGAPIDHAGLLRYIVSLRQHNEFHEHCVERIFCALRERCAPHELAVWARYTRRGGLDINPFRVTPGCTWAMDERGDMRQ